MKGLLKVGFVLLALLVIAGVLVMFSLDRIAAETIRRGGSYALGVETSVDSVDISLGSQVEASLTGLGVANPEGFDAERFLRLGAGSLSFPRSSLFDEQVSVPELALDGIEINLERRGGKNNYDVILEHLEKLGGPGEAEQEPGGKRFTIERIVLTDIDATIDLLPLGGDLTRVSIHVPEIVLEDLSDGMSTAQVFGIVVRALLTAVLQNAGGLLPADMLKDLGGKLGALGQVAFDLTGGAVETSAELISKGGELLLEGVEELGDQAGKALEGLGDILKKDD